MIDNVRWASVSAMAGFEHRWTEPVAREAAGSGTRATHLAVEHARDAASVGDLTWTAGAPERSAGLGGARPETRAGWDNPTMPQWSVKPASALVRPPSVLVGRLSNG